MVSISPSPVADPPPLGRYEGVGGIWPPTAMQELALRAAVQAGEAGLVAWRAWSEGIDIAHSQIDAATYHAYHPPARLLLHLADLWALIRGEALDWDAFWQLAEKSRVGERAGMVLGYLQGPPSPPQFSAKMGGE